MDKEEQIITALQRAAMAAAEAEQTPIKILGRTFNVPDGPWLEIVHIPNNVTGEFWADGKTYRGLFRLMLHYPLNDAGIYAPTRLISAIAAHFHKGAVFTAGGVSVKIYDEPDLTGMIEAPPEMLFPVSIRYMSFQP